MYVAVEDEALITQDIGPKLARQWQAVLRAAYKAEERGGKAKLAMLRLPGGIHQQIGRLLHNTPGVTEENTPQSMVTAFRVSGTDEVVGKVLALIPPSLKQTLIDAHRATLKAEALRCLAWRDIEERFTPHEEWNLGIRDHMEGDTELLALVHILHTPQEKPKSVDDFIGDLFGRAEGSGPQRAA